jgi:hypothetical protein
VIPNEAITFLTTVVSASLITGSIVWGFSAFLSSKLNVIHSRIEKAQEVILAKLEYHERHDDQRFTAVHNELWAIKVRNAAKDSNIEIKEK